MDEALKEIIGKKILIKFQAISSMVCGLTEYADLRNNYSADEMKEVANYFEALEFDLERFLDQMKRRAITECIRDSAMYRNEK